MKRLPTFLFLVGAIVLFAIAAPEGASSQSICRGAECEVSAETSLFAVIFGIAFGLLASLLPRSKTHINPTQTVNLVRRLAALCVSLIVILITFAPLLVLLDLAIEWAHTGAFKWSFHREFWRTTDGLVGIPSTFSILALLFYFKGKAAVTGRPTFGQYVAGYQVLNDGKNYPNRGWRWWIGLTLIALIVWPATLLILATQGKKALLYIPKYGSTGARFEYADQKSLS